MSIVDGHYRHGLRRMRGRSITEHGRAATPLELLFDLTFVAAFGVAGNELAHAIAVGHPGPGALGFTAAMVALVWAWINFTWFASAFDTDDWLFRALTMVQMVGVIVLAIGLPAMFASIDHGEVFDNRVMVAGYVVMRVGLILQWLRAAKSDPTYRVAALSYAGFVGAAQIGWIVVAIVPFTVPQATVAFVILMLIELGGPITAEIKGAKKGGGATPWHPHHIAERYALLAIIALGETVFGTLASATEISNAQGWSFDAIVVVASGIALSFAMWWTYFLVPHGEVLAARRTKAFPWGYGHIVLFGAIAAVGAGLHVVGYAYDEHYHLSSTTVTLSIAIPVLLFFVSLYLLHSWLISHFTSNAPLQAIVLLLPVAAVVISMLGAPLWVSLLVVLAAPLLIIVSYEFGAWRALDAALARATAPVSDGAR